MGDAKAIRPSDDILVERLPLRSLPAKNRHTSLALPSAAISKEAMILSLPSLRISHQGYLRACQDDRLV